MYVEFIGLIAAALTTSSFVPQLYKLWKYKTADGVSLTMYLVMLTGVILWEIYGILIESIAVIVSNIVTASLLLIILYYKVKYK
ncbi:MAG: SemiSWEET family sugar transporter [Flavobacteriaceae bacterium]